jgi:hypothetical protein
MENVQWKSETGLMGKVEKVEKLKRHRGEPPRQTPQLLNLLTFEPFKLSTVLLPAVDLRAT